MAIFEKAFDLTLGHEGGYVNDPHDPGGETYKGIARRRHGTWQGWVIIDKLKKFGDFPKNLDEDSALQSHVKEFYKKEFWDVMRLDDLNDQTICNEMFDTAVNQGSGTAARYLQEALNVLNRGGKDYKDIAVDGKIGRITLGIVNSHPRAYNVLKALNGLQFMKYYNLAKNDEKFEKYLNGWLNRVTF